MEEENNNINDTAQVERIINLVRLMQGFQNNNTQEQQKEAEQPEQHFEVQQKNSFDDELQFPALRVIKAAIPYLDYGYQKNLAIMIKLIEMDGLLKRYSSLLVEGQGVKTVDKKSMLMAIKPELELRHQKVLDMFLKVVEIKEIMEGLNSGGY